ncbi:hypothetical protein WN71_012580 [Streptomyces mangrovisoli]|uniref:Uncharacterized protein n=2 Tax=Streptomyces mangrovisoli TaxID=1428628 RepID=A0A1J4P1W0_9ACTN|nr:hypothetical protein WN71_012580 [Streptomyces mangrovisoli]
MAVGIMSIGLRLTGYEVLSGIALVLACATWLGLAVNFAVRLLGERERWMAEAATPGALTSVAATAVLGARFSLLGWQPLAAVLLALSALLWPGLLLTVVRNWQWRMPGTVFLGCVATEGLAVLAAVLAAARSSEWLAHTALVLFWLGLVIYCLALPRFDRRQVIEGAGDQWIAGGALAISSLAGSRLLAVDDSIAYLWNDDDAGVLRYMAVALLVLDLCCWAVLVVAEAARPRLRYDELRWATVFPMGMTAVAALSIADVDDVPWLHDLGQALLWVSVLAGVVVAAGAVRAARDDLGGKPPRHRGIRSTGRR